MKLKHLPVALAGTMISCLVHAEGPIDGKVYGKINANFQNTDTSAGDAWELSSNASRLGFKGKTNLSEHLDAIYQVEYEIFVDDGDKSGRTVTQRNTYLGFSGGFGSIMAGKHDTPFKLAQGKIDLFNDLYGDIKNLVHGENRIDNVVMYVSPEMSGFSGNLAFAPGENAGVSGEDGPADAISGSLGYKSGDLSVRLAFDSDVGGKDSTRLAAAYKLDNVKLGLLWQETENSDGTGSSEDGVVASAAFGFGANTIKVQYGASDMKVMGGKQASVGVDHKLSKNAKLYAFYTDFSADAAADESSAAGVGAELKF